MGGWGLGRPARPGGLPLPEGRNRAAFGNGRSGRFSVAKAAGQVPCGARGLKYCRNFNWGGGGGNEAGVTR